jgi:HSP20 family protein
MKLAKRNSNLLNSFPALFDDFFNRDLFDWGQTNFSNTNTTIPAINMKETNGHYEVELAAPGMSKKDFTIQLEDNVLTIRSEKTTENNGNENENGRYISREFSYQSFQRSFTLQKEVVDADKIEARYEDGVLHLLIPKKEEAKRKEPRLIAVA